ALEPAIPCCGAVESRRQPTIQLLHPLEKLSPTTRKGKFFAPRATQTSMPCISQIHIDSVKRGASHESIILARNNVAGHDVLCLGSGQPDNRRQPAIAVLAEQTKRAGARR